MYRREVPECPGNEGIGIVPKEVPECSDDEGIGIVSKEVPEWFCDAGAKFYRRAGYISPTTCEAFT